MVKSSKPTNLVEGGYIALVAVLVIGAVATAIMLTLLLGGTDAQRAVVVERQSIQARSLAAACAEEALQQIHDATSFSGTNTLTLSTGTCTYTVTNTGSNTRTIITTGSVQTVVRKVQVYVTINTSSISAISWQEVS